MSNQNSMTTIFLLETQKKPKIRSLPLINPWPFLRSAVITRRTKRVKANSMKAIKKSKQAETMPPTTHK
jgi:hypothetical protein